MVHKRVLLAVLMAGWSTLVAMATAYFYSQRSNRKLLTDVTDLMEGLKYYVETATRGQ
jgi:hypothetical protein